MAKYLSIKMYCRFFAVCLVLLATVYLKDHIPYSYIPTFSNGQLTRSYAKELLRHHDKFVKITMLPYNHLENCTFSTTKGLDELIELGINEGLWVKSDRSTYAVALSHYGEKYFTLGENSSTINGFVLDDQSNREITEVTGIADGPELLGGKGIKEVQFTWEYDLPEVIERYFKLDNRTFEGAALMRLYDDGWRVEEIELKGEVLLQ